MVTPTARTLAECRKRGWIAQVVEQTIPRTFIKRDLFGVIDIIAIEPPKREKFCDDCQKYHDVIPPNSPSAIVGIQATGGQGGHHAERVAKILAEPRARAWIEAGARLEVWSWAKQGAAGKRKTWTLRTEAITLEMFDAAKAAA